MKDTLTQSAPSGNSVKRARAKKDPFITTISSMELSWAADDYTFSCLSGSNTPLTPGSTIPTRIDPGGIFGIQINFRGKTFLLDLELDSNGLFSIVNDAPGIWSLTCECSNVFTFKCKVLETPIIATIQLNNTDACIIIVGTVPTTGDGENG
jgi:hypothetical protein